MSKAVRNTIIAIVTVVFAVTILFFVYYGVSYNAKDNIVADLVNTGNDYMAAGSYQDAIKKYEAALEHEPENKELKNAIAHSYVCLAGTLGDSIPAVDAYQNALTYNSLNTNAYWGMAGVYERLGDEDNMLLALQTGYTNTEDVDMRTKAQNVEIERARKKAEEEAAAKEAAEKLEIEERHNGLLSALLDMFNVEEPDLEAIKELIRTEAYIDLVDEVIGIDDSFYYGETDSEGRRLGKGIAVYRDGYFYYGDYMDGMRYGQGIYLRAVYSESSSKESFVYEGGFRDDKPNGSGTCTTSFYKEKIISSEFLKQVVSGNYSDGKEDGKMELTGTKKGGSEVKYSYRSDNGIAEKSSDENSGIKGQYIIATSSDEKSNLSSDGSERGVEGFIIEE